MHPFDSWRSEQNNCDLLWAGRGFAPLHFNQPSFCGADFLCEAFANSVQRADNKEDIPLHVWSFLQGFLVFLLHVPGQLGHLLSFPGIGRKLPINQRNQRGPIPSDLEDCFDRLAF